MNKLIELYNRMNKWLWYHTGFVTRRYVKPIHYEAYFAPRLKYLKVALWFGLGVLVGAML